MRCLIVDDNTSFLAAACTLLEREGLTVVGTARNAVQAIDCTEELTPDVVLVDIDLGAESGFSLARRLAARFGSFAPALILISTHPHDDFAELVDESPAAGFIAKSELSARAIEQLLGGLPEPLI